MEVSRMPAALPPARDVLLAVALGAASVGGALLAAPSGRPLLPSGALLIGVAVLVLCWRRRYPVTVLFAVTAVVAVYYWLQHPDGPASILVAAAVYTVASRLSWPRAVLAGLVVVLAWVGVEVLIVNGPPRPWADHFGWIVVTVAVGVAVGAARRAAEASAERTEERLRRRVEQERLRIARDVHDVVSHSLSMIVVQAGVGAHVATRRPEEAVAALERIRDAGGEALRELRTTLRVLRADDDPDDGPAGDPPGLARLDEVVRAARSAGLAVELRGSADARSAGAALGADARSAGAALGAGTLPPPVDRAAFAIVREAVTNTVRHAPDATTSRVGFERAAAELRIRIADDGGARPAGARDRAGQGLRGLAERAAALGGTVRSGPEAGGFVVTAVLPVGSGTAAADPRPPERAAEPEHETTAETGR